MKWTLALLLGALFLVNEPAQAQQRGWRGAQEQKQGFAPRGREDREELRRERTERGEQRREQRFTPEERDKLRQDLLDANREMRGRRR